MFEKFEHIGVKVSDMERSIDFYTQVMGMQLVDRKELGTIQLAFVELGGQQFELICGARPPEGAAGPIDHLAFTVSDLAAAQAHVSQRYPEAVFEDTLKLWDGCRCTFFRGPDGERLELFERPV